MRRPAGRLGMPILSAVLALGGATGMPAAWVAGIPVAPVRRRPRATSSSTGPRAARVPYASSVTGSTTRPATTACRRPP